MNEKRKENVERYRLKRATVEEGGKIVRSDSSRIIICLLSNVICFLRSFIDTAFVGVRLDYSVERVEKKKRTYGLFT